MDELDLERYWAIVRPNRRKPPEPRKLLDPNSQMWVEWVNGLYLSGERVPVTITPEGKIPIIFPTMGGPQTIVAFRFYVNPDDWQLLATVPCNPVNLDRGDVLQVELNIGPDSFVRNQVIGFKQGISL